MPVDYFTKWPKIDKFGNLSNTNVIQYMQDHFSRYGIPDSVMSDDRPQFREFRIEYFLQSHHHQDLLPAMD